MAKLTRPPLDILIGTRIATWLRRLYPQLTTRHLHGIRALLGFPGALLMVPAGYATDIIGSLLFVTVLLLRQSGHTLHNLRREPAEIGDIRIDRLVSGGTLMLYLLCIGVAQISILGPRSLGFALIALILLVSLQVLLLYREEQLRDRPLWRGWHGYTPDDLQYLFPLLTAGQLTWLVLEGALVVLPLVIGWVVWRIIRD